MDKYVKVYNVDYSDYSSDIVISKDYLKQLKMKQAIEIEYGVKQKTISLHNYGLKRKKRTLIIVHKKVQCGRSECRVRTAVI